MTSEYYDYSSKNNITTAVFNKDCKDVKNNKSTPVKLTMHQHMGPNKILLDSDTEYIIMNSDDENTDLTINENRSNFEIFDISIPLYNKLICKSKNKQSVKECPINLYHSCDKTILLNFELPLLLLRPDKRELSSYSVLCYTNYGFFGVYPVELMDLTDKSGYNTSDCEKGKLPCVFNVNIENVELPPDKNITLNIHIINSKHNAQNICYKFKSIDNEELVYNIDYITAPIYMIMNNFSFSIL